MSMVTGNQNRECNKDERGNQAASPPSIFLPSGELQIFDASFEPPHRVVIVTGNIG